LPLLPLPLHRKEEDPARIDDLLQHLHRGSPSRRGVSTTPS
jgi:hypothetical protein